MKRYISLILMLAVILAVMFVLQACGGKNETTTDPTVGQTQLPTEAPTQPATEEDEKDWSSGTDVEWSDTTMTTTPTNPTEATNSNTQATQKPAEPTQPTESTNPTETEEWNEDEWSTESDVEWIE